MTANKHYVAVVVLIAMAAAIRLIGITKPLIDKQYWRQTDTASIARNFFEEDMNIFYPRVNWRGNTRGYVESEFPLYPFLVACLYKIHGTPNETLGRIVSVFSAILTVLILYLFVLKLFDQETAFYSAMFYAVSPLAAYYTRTFMPESMMMLFYLLGIYLFYLWVYDNNRLAGIFALAATSLALLVKLTALIMIFPMLGILYDRYQWGFLRQKRVWGFFALSFIAPALWYWHAYHLFLETGLSFGIISGVGYNKFMTIPVLFSLKVWSVFLFRFFGILLTPVGGTIFLMSIGIGLSKRTITGNRIFLYVWILSIALYTIVVAEGNRVLEYYQIFLVPVAGIFIARGVLFLNSSFSGKIFNRLVYTVIVLCAFMFYSEHFVWNLYPYAEDSYAFAQKVRYKTESAALFMVIDTDGRTHPDWYKKMKHRISSPSLLYYLHRKGWVILPYEMACMKPIDLDEFIFRGARYFAAPRFVLEKNEKISGIIRDRNWKLLEEDENFVLYELE